MQVRVLVIGFLLARTVTASASDSDRRAALYAADEIRTRLLAAQKLITSLRVEYRSYDYDQERYPKGSYLHRIVAARSPHDLYHLSTHGHDRLDWRDDPFQQRATVTKDRLDNEFYLSRTYFECGLRPEEGLPGTLPNEFFFIATGLWPLEGREPIRPDGRPYVLREVAVSADYSRVRPFQEKVDGRWCHVLEFPRNDRLWLDVDRGCALLARETHSRRTGGMVQRVELGGHREAAPGIWMPTWVRNIQYDYNAPTEEGRRRVYLDARLQIVAAEVNRVDAGLFAFRPRPGSMRWTNDEPLTQVQPGGLAHLDEMARWVRRSFPLSEPDRFASVSPTYATGGAVLLLIVGCELIRRRSRPSAIRES
jgi:hypothetical protein